MKKNCLAILLFISSFAFSQKKINDLAISVNTEQAFTLQKESKKPILFFFYTDWCKYCYTMKKNTFTDEKIVQLINDNFYFVLFNAESKEPVTLKRKTFENKQGTHELAIALASKNGYMSYPSLVILNHKSRIDEQVDTVLSSKQLNELLTEYLKKQKR